jgi:hypothetical protein
MVSAGEVCTEAKAKELGLTDLEAIRTYSETDANDYTKTEALCRISDNRAQAYPMCALEHGFAFAQVPGDLSRCATPSCPPGFVAGSNQQCYKPTSSILKDKTNICEEKAYDWYTIPYYQLGNGYRKGSDGKCYEPCRETYVPLVTEDPVDKDKWAVTFSDNSIKTDGSQCVSINDYFNNKYGSKADTGMEYCPMAIIRRLAASTEGLKDELKANAQPNMELLEDQLPSSTRVRVNSKIAAEATRVALDTKMNLKNVKSGSTPMQIACGRMVDDAEIGTLYGICKNLKETPSKLYSVWRTDNPGAPDSVLATRRAVMEQACHEVFCNARENAMIAGGEPICFTPKNVSQAELDDHNNTVVTHQRQVVASLTDGGTRAYTTPQGKLRDSPDTGGFVKKSIKIVLSILLTLLTLLAALMFIRMVILFFNLNTELALAKTQSRAT